MLTIKMQLTVQTTIEAYRQYVSGELPEEFKELVGSDEFKVTFDQACKANTEILHNMITLADELGVVFGHDFRNSLPSTPEQFSTLAAEIAKEIDALAGANRPEWNVNFKND
jgi:predicted ATP-dependent protease